MKTLSIHNSSKTIFSIFMIVSAIGEITLNETVVHSMRVIFMPEYLLFLLGGLKILGVLAIWFSPYDWIKEWAYAGFVFDFVGAIYAFVVVGVALVPDVFMAPIALVLCLGTYVSWKKTKVPTTATPSNR